MKLLMISGDRSLAQGKKGAFYSTLEEFSRHFERIDILCPFVKDQALSSDAPLPITDMGNVYIHPSPRGLWYQPLWILRRGCELARQYGHDRMTVHEFPPFYNGMGACVLYKKTRIPYAIEIHHIVGEPQASTITEAIGFFLTRILLRFDVRHAAKVRVVNGRMQGLLPVYGVPPQKISLVPSFYLDKTLLAPDPSIKKEFDLAFAARLVPNKGLPALLEAISLMPSATLLIIGDGPKRAAYEALAKELDITDRVTFCGWLPTQQDVVREMQRAKIFVMNSSSEGGPRSALEAMACGMPVVATRVGVMEDVIEDKRNGVFTTGRTQDLRDKISLFLNDDRLRMECGQAATKIVDRFERVNSIKAYADFLKALA